MAEAKSQSASPLAASPETQSLIDQITQITVKPSDESYGKMRDAVGFFLAEMLKTEHQGAKVDKQAVGFKLMGWLAMESIGGPPRVISHPPKRG